MDREGAIAPLEKLIELYPEREDYKVVLEQTRLELGEKGEDGDAL